MIAFLAQIPYPAPGTVESWLLSAAAVLGMLVLGKMVFTKVPPDHERFANKDETNRRLDDIEDQISEVIRQAATDKTDLVSRIDSVPYKTIALLKDMKGLIPQEFQ